jgi:hypothetical protein
MRVAQFAMVGILLLGLNSRAAGGTVTLGTSPHPSVSVENADPERTGGLFAGKLVPLQRCSYFLTNNSDKDVVAVDAKWTLVDKSGNTDVWRFTSDSFLDVKARPVIAAHSRILVGPRMWVREDSIQSYLASEMLMAKRAALEKLAGRLAAASAVYVGVDSLIFADGEVAGPNSDEFDREIARRKLAAEDVLGVVQDARLSGRDPAVALRAFVARMDAAGADPRATWGRRFARQLQDPERFEGNLYYLEHLPPPPKFYRTGIGPDVSTRR